MRKAALVCMLSALAACSQSEPAPPPEAKSANPAVVGEDVPSWPLEPGTYQYSRSDGTSGTNTLAADGTFTNEPTGGRTETGTWAMEGGLACMAPAEGFKRCYRFTKPDAEGNFSGAMPNGITVNVRKVS